MYFFSSSLNSFISLKRKENLNFEIFFFLFWGPKCAFCVVEGEKCKFFLGCWLIIC